MPNKPHPNRRPVKILLFGPDFERLTNACARVGMCKQAFIEGLVMDKVNEILAPEDEALAARERKRR